MFPHQNSHMADSDSDGSSVDAGAAAVPCGVEPAVPASVEVIQLIEVLKEVEVGGTKILFYEPDIADGDTVSTITRASVLAKRHLLLPAAMAEAVARKSQACIEMVYNWPGGSTSCGNAMWSRFMTPLMEEVKVATRKKAWRDVLAGLLAIFLIGAAEDNWLEDQEVSHEWDEFRKWFTWLSTAWKTLLQQSDADLGLANPHGKPAGYYRGVLTDGLKSWADEVNPTLDRLRMHNEKPARIVVPRLGKVSTPKAAELAGKRKEHA